MIREGGPWSSAWKIAAGIGGVGAVLAGVGATMDGKRFAFAYLFAYFAFLTIALGAAFFVIVQRLTSAGWSVTVRRTAEFIASALPVFAVLAIPIFLNFGKLYPMMSRQGQGAHASILESNAYAADLHPGIGHTASAAAAAPPGHAAPAADSHGAAPAHAAPADAHGAPAAHAAPADHAAAGEHGGGHAAGGHGEHDPGHLIHEETLEKKSAWFSKNFFYGRGIAYVLFWAFLGLRLFNMSVKQDKSKDVKLTLKAQGSAPLLTVGFALSLTFAAFDWIMALEPSWFSTIFGVYTFATTQVSSLSTIVLITMSLQKAGLTKSTITTEHFHDLGKLLFGFTAFWGYIAFSQFMLIWYAALPEETTFYHTRWDGEHAPWAMISLLMVVGHFIFPFFLLMSRHSKRTHPERLKFGAMWTLCMHVIEWYWLVMPNLYPTEYSFHWMDVACVLAVGGIFFAVVFWRMTKHALIPVGDPRLLRSIHFQNA
ncbi:MAG: hypothetical protein U0174_19605 [Polyangiaceae bacterium]